MTYELVFDPRAYREWKKLGETVRAQFKKKIVEVLIQPRIEAARLHDFPDCYKIKLRSSGYRLIYQVRDNIVMVFVIAVGKREKSTAYRQPRKRL
ncbi:MAG: addiction module toxin RelE [Proteobacteria bacterium]|nr:addiction module toxin RelE [Pseudomonadota bacterium]